jgi:hypothetical protein
MYWNYVAIDGVIKKQISTQQDATPKGKNPYYQPQLVTLAALRGDSTEFSRWELGGRTHTQVTKLQYYATQSPSRGIMWNWSRVYSNKRRDIFQMEANAWGCTPGRCMALLLPVSTADTARTATMRWQHYSTNISRSPHSYVSSLEVRKIIN